MASIHIILDPEDPKTKPIEYTGKLIHLSDDAEIHISGLPDGMVGEDGSKKPSIMIAIKLPENDDLVVVETSWRLFSSAFHAFYGKFGEAHMEGMRLETDEGGPMEFVASEKPFILCNQPGCGWRIDGESTQASMLHIWREYFRHYKKRHPKVEVPPPPPMSWLN
jgi:hypothetical protein